MVEDDVKDSKEGEERVKGTNVQELNYDKKKDIITVYKVEREDVIGIKDIVIEDLHWKYEFEIYI